MHTLCDTAAVPSTVTEAFRATHGTTPAAAAAITTTGFSASGPRCFLGAGVYLCRDRDEASFWAARAAAAATIGDGRWADVDWDAPYRCALVDVEVPAGLRHVTLTMRSTAWGGFRALGDADGTLVERYSSDAETRAVGMVELAPRVAARYATEHALDVIEVVLDRPDELARTSQLVVLPHAIDALDILDVSTLNATCQW